MNIIKTYYSLLRLPFFLFFLNCSGSFQTAAVFRGDSPLFFNLTSMDLTESDTKTLTLALTKKPSDNVMVTLSASSLRLALNPAQLTFTPANYDQPQSIQVSGVNNCRQDPDENVTIETSQIASNDTLYSSTGKVQVPVTIKDSADNLPQIIFTQNSQLTTSELGTIAFFKVNLSCAPATGNSVTIPLVVDKPTEVSIDKSSLAFTDTNFATYQTVTITGLPDCTPDGNQSFTISSGDVSSADTRFARYANAAGSSQIHAQVTGTNMDYAINSDTNITLLPGNLDMTLQWDPITHIAAHPDPFISFSVSLTCPITSTVYFSFLSTDTTNTSLFTDAFGSPTNSFAKVANTASGYTYLAFNSSNWSAPQSVLIQLDTTNANQTYFNSTITGYNSYTPPFSDNTVHKIKMYQSAGDSGQSVISSPVYADKTLNVNITVNSW